MTSKKKEDEDLKSTFLEGISTQMSQACCREEIAQAAEEIAQCSSIHRSLEACLVITSQFDINTSTLLQKNKIKTMVEGRLKNLNLSDRCGNVEQFIYRWFY